MNALENAVKKVWGYNPAKLTPRGLSYLLQDLLQLMASLMFIVYYPKVNASEPMIQWLGAAGLLAITVYVFMPSVFRVMMGNYESWVEEDEAGA